MFNNTVDDITKGLNKMVSKLEKLSDDLSTRINLNEYQMNTLKEQNLTLSSEKTRANKVAAKIKELVS